MFACVATAIPLMVVDGLTGFGIGMAIAAAVGIAGRIFYLVRLFPAFGVLRHSARAIVPTIPGATIVLVLRQFDGRRAIGSRDRRGRALPARHGRPHALGRAPPAARGQGLPAKSARAGAQRLRCAGPLNPLVPRLGDAGREACELDARRTFSSEADLASESIWGFVNPSRSVLLIQ